MDLPNMGFVPYFRTPLTDIGSYMASHQEYGPCPQLEMQMVSCLEAYGVYRGKEKCKDIIHDYYECFQGRTNVKRALAMKAERLRQFKAGERKKQHIESPSTIDF